MAAEDEADRKEIVLHVLTTAGFGCAVPSLAIVCAGPAAFALDNDQVDGNFTRGANVRVQLDLRQIPLRVARPDQIVGRGRDIDRNLREDLESAAGGKDVGDRARNQQAVTLDHAGGHRDRSRELGAHDRVDRKLGIERVRDGPLRHSDGGFARDDGSTSVS